VKRLLFPPFPDARKSEFLPPVQRDATRPVPHAKIFRFAVDPNQQYDLRVPSRKECIGRKIFVKLGASRRKSRSRVRSCSRFESGCLKIESPAISLAWSRRHTRKPPLRAAPKSAGATEPPNVFGGSRLISAYQRLPTPTPTLTPGARMPTPARGPSSQSRYPRRSM